MPAKLWVTVDLPLKSWSGIVIAQYHPAHDLTFQHRNEALHYGIVSESYRR